MVWLGIYFFGCIGFFPAYTDLKYWHTQNKLRKISNHQEKKELKYLEELANTVIVPSSPVDVWKSILKDDNLSWAVFENGTLVTMQPCHQSEVCKKAKIEIEKYKNLGVGSSLGDFSVDLNESAGVWLVSYPEGNIFNYIAVDDIKNSGVAGLIAREVRSDDAKERAVVYVSH